MVSNQRHSTRVRERALFHSSARRLGGGLLLAFFCCGLTFGWGADVLQGPIRGGFSVAEADRETGQRRFLLRGESATPVSADEWAIQGARLEVYGGEGVTNLVFTPAQCIYQQKAQRVMSSEELRVVTGDGQMTIQGVGFGLDLITGRLVVSNQVQAIFRKDFVQADTRPGSATSRIAVPTSETAESIRIRSDRMEYEGGQALFLGQVRVDDAQGWITCRRLRVDLDLDTRRAVRIVAQDDVGLESSGIVAQAGLLTYDPLSERLELEGNPRWQVEGRTGRADRALVDRLEQRIEAWGQVEMEVAADALLPGGTWPESLEPVVEQRREEPRLVRVRSDVFRFGPDLTRTNGNVAIFQGHVQVADEALRMDCGQLTVETEEPGQQARRAVASENVVLERASERITCAEAVYDAPRMRVTLTGGTTWRTDEREGQSETMMLDLAGGRYRAEGRVRMRLKGEGFGVALGWVDPEAVVASGLASDETLGEPTPPRWIEIESEWFEYRTALEGSGFETAVYEGEVVVREGEQFVMTSALLTARLEAETRQVEELMAAGEVELRMLESDGYRVARGDRAVYAADRGTVELTGMDGVEFFVVTADGVSRGLGRRALYDRTTELLELDGRPVITTPQGELTGDVVRLDRAHSTLSAAGAWRIRLPMGTYRMPELPAP